MPDAKPLTADEEREWRREFRGKAYLTELRLFATLDAERARAETAEAERDEARTHVLRMDKSCDIRDTLLRKAEAALAQAVAERDAWRVVDECGWSDQETHEFIVHQSFVDDARRLRAEAEGR